MGHQSRARNQRRESARRFGKAIKNGWMQPTPPMPPQRSPYPLLALALWGAVATVAIVGLHFGWWPQ